MNRLALIGLAAVWLVPTAFAAPGRKLPLQPGVYVERGTPCADAPFAAMKVWDGEAFSGPHSSQCVTRVLRAHRTTFVTRTTCGAQGDGTPVQPDVENATVTVSGRRQFRYTRPNVDEAVYRWCSRK